MTRHVTRSCPGTFEADAQRNVTRDPANLAVGRKVFGVEPTFEIKSGSVRVVPQRLVHSDVLVVQSFEYRRRGMVHASRKDSTYRARTRALVHA